MDPAVLLILLLMLALAGVSFYLGWLAPPHEVLWRSRLRASFIFIALFMLPFLLWVLWAQHTETGRLAEIGIVPYPGITFSIGAGSVAQQMMALSDIDGKLAQHWIFNVNGAPEAIVTFYQDPENRPGWNIREHAGSSLILQREDGVRLSISGHERYGEVTLVYLLMD